MGHTDGDWAVLRNGDDKVVAIAALKIERTRVGCTIRAVEGFIACYLRMEVLADNIFGLCSFVEVQDVLCEGLIADGCKQSEVVNGFTIRHTFSFVSYRTRAIEAIDRQTIDTCWNAGNRLLDGEVHITAIGDEVHHFVVAPFISG